MPEGCLQEILVNLLKISMVFSKMISKIIKIIPAALEWQNRPLHIIYLIVFIDCIHFNIKMKTWL